MEQKIKHLEFIQNVINRLSTNSFLLKGWSVVLVSALFAFAAYDSSTKYILLAYIPAIVFWGLDGYFLALERAYRKLYDQVRKKKNDKIDFSMEIDDLNPGFHTWLCSTFSKSLVPFHGSIILAIILVMLIQV